MKRSKIARAMDHLDEDLIAESMEAPKSAHPAWMRWVALAAALALVLMGTILIGGLIGRNDPTHTIIALDINPSLEIELDETEHVVAVTPLNEDARIVVGDMDFAGVDLDLAINALVGSLLRHGYLSTDRNSILISVDAADQSHAASLQKTLSDEITALLGGHQIEASVITQSFDQQAPTTDGDGMEISSARDTLVRRILAAGMTDAKGTPYTYDQLAVLNINELKLILENKGLTVEGIEGVEFFGHASYGDLISAEQALSIVLEKCGIASEHIQKLEIELDVGKKTRVVYYEIEFEANGMEYEYELLATTGDILSESVEPADRHDDDNRPVIDGSCISDRDARSLVTEHLKNHHAAVTFGSVDPDDCDLTVKDGRMVYEIEVDVAGDRECEYILDAKTGEILAHRVPVDPAADPTAAKARDLALAHAGLKASAIRKLEMEVAYTGSDITAYRVEFEGPRDTDYEYTVNAAADEILRHEIDD